MHVLPPTRPARARRHAPRWRGLAVAALGALLCASGCAGLPPEIRQARQLFERGAYGEADAAADRALERYPDHPEPWRIKIQSAMARRDSRGAVTVYGTWRARRGADDRTALEDMAVTTLWQGLRVPSGQVRARSVAIVERLEIEKLARDVTRLLGDDDDLVAAAAAVALLRSHVAAGSIAAELLHSDVAEARTIVVAGAGRKAAKMTRSELVAALDDPAPVVRRAAIHAVASLEDATDTERFVALAKKDPDGEVRGEALRALGQPTRQGLPGDLVRLLEQALSDAHPDARRAAIAALAAHDLLGPVRRAAAADDLVIALPAAAVLHERGEGRYAPLLARALADPAPDLRATALDHAARLVAGPDALASARAALGDSDETVRLAAARALLALGDDGGLVALGTLTREASDPAVREAAVTALGQARKPTPEMIAALADPAATVRLTAAEIILRVIH